MSKTRGNAVFFTVFKQDYSHEAGKNFWIKVDLDDDQFGVVPSFNNGYLLFSALFIIL